MTTLAKRLADTRDARGWSQSELARRVDVKPQTIQAIEAGRVRKPANLVTIAKTLGVDPNYLLTGRGLNPDEAKVSGERAIKTMLKRIDGLPDEAIEPVWIFIRAYLQDAERQRSAQLRGQSESANPRRGSKPSQRQFQRSSS